MTVHSYETFVLLPQSMTTDWNTLERQLLAAGWLQRCGPQQLNVGPYVFEFSLESGPEVEEENIEVIRMLGLTDTAFPRRLAFFGALDEEMECFNDFVFLLELLEKQLPGAVFFDPQSGEQL